MNLKVIQSDFQKAIRNTERNMRASSTQIVMSAGWAFTKGAKNATKKARKGAKREVFYVERIGSKKSGSGQKSLKQFGVVIKKQGKPDRLVLVNRNVTTKAQAKALSIAKVPHIGASKNSWNGAMRDLGQSAGTKMRSVSDAKLRGRNTVDATLLIVNKLSYLLKIAPNVEAEGMRRATKTMIKKLDWWLAKEAKAWA